LLRESKVVHFKNKESKVYGTGHFVQLQKTKKSTSDFLGGGSFLW